MQQAFDYKQFIVLVVDDEEIFLDMFKAAFGDQFRILTAGDAEEGLNLLKQHKDEVGVLVANLCMPGHDGVWLLEQARDVKPHLVRMLSSAMCPPTELLALCRIGLHKFISHPFARPAMEQTLRGALEHFAEMNAFIGSAWPATQVPRTTPTTAR